MPNRIFRHIHREPVHCLAVVLFTGMLALLLCILYQTRQQELTDYQEAFASIPVKFSITDFDGTRLQGYTEIPSSSPLAPNGMRQIEGIEGWAADLFYEEGHLTPNFSDLTKDVGMVMSYYADNRGIYVVGSSGLWLLPELTEEYGGSITWVKGYDESIFQSDELVCVVPEGYTQAHTVELHFSYLPTNAQLGQLPYTHSCELKVVGYAKTTEFNIYCSYDVIAKIHSHIKAPYKLDAIGATLSDNTRLDELQQIADNWFARPNRNGEFTPWGKYGYEYFPYALRIDDGLLQNLNSTMERSLTVNRLSSLAIFIISAGAGFLVGFLVIRSRKREITLMRTLGCADKAIYGEFASEQMLCAALGTAIGGGYTLWQPLGQLGLFLVIYFLGLSAALLIFLCKNLLTTIKEDE